MPESSDESARRYARLVDRCLDEVYRTALRLCGSRDEAEDLAHDAFVKARRGIAKLPEDARDRAWLFRILRNAWIDRQRRSGRLPELVRWEPETEVAGEACAGDATGVEATSVPTPVMRDADDDIGREVIEQQFDDHLLEALDALPEDLRLALYLQIFGGLDYAEIAAALDCPIGTVMSRLHRAKSRLRGSLIDYAGQNGFIDREHKTHSNHEPRNEKRHG